MKKTLSRWLLDVWYKDPFIGVLLLPLGFLFTDIARFRRTLYQNGMLKSTRLPVPVIVVGNISVGGTGKTPLVIALAQLLIAEGYRVGIISRGYGGKEATPQRVTADSDPAQVGDEAVLIAQQTNCPVVVAPLRVAAGEFLLAHQPCDVILSDDGLQHYKLKRDIEIVVIDGERRHGNSYCLPAGPLREPIDRIHSADFIVVNGEKSEPEEFAMQLIGDSAINLKTGEKKNLREFIGEPCHAVAAIGNPDRFFKQLTAAGLSCKTHGFVDHHVFQASEVDFGNAPVLMTEKDAVKCRGFASAQHWFVPVNAVLNADFTARLLAKLRAQPTSNLKNKLF